MKQERLSLAAWSRHCLLAAVCCVPVTACGARAQLGVQLDPTGGIAHLTLTGKPVTGSVDLYLPKPGWAGTVGSLNRARITARQSSEHGAEQRIRGVVSAAGKPVLTFSRWVQQAPDHLRLRFEVTPQRDVEVAALLIRIWLPVASFHGQTWLLNQGGDTRDGLFPDRLPSAYVFLHEAGFDWFGWAVSTGRFLTAAPDWRYFSHMQVQDDRRFKADGYEVQFYGKTSGTLKKGVTYTLPLVFQVVDKTKIAAARRESRRRRQELKSSMTGQGPAKFLEVRPEADRVPVFGRFELKIALQAEFANPFDPDDVSLEAHFVTPQGNEQVVPGFFYWGCARRQVNGVERVTPSGEHHWRVRYSPATPGTYRYYLTLTDGRTQARTKPASFRAVESPEPGFVRVAKRNPLYFEFDNGAPYFAIGENVCWPGPGGTYDYDNYWRKLSENGANYARLWIGPFDCFTLERTAHDADDPFGLGRYDLVNSWRVDYVIEEAAKRGIHVMFCIDSFNSLRIRPAYPRWNECPYNAANGGPCHKPEEFFTNPEALKLFRRRLRYIVARWSYSPAVLSWEFWNEVNIVEKYVSRDVVRWHREMARYLRGLDPSNHLITTSWAGVDGDPKVDTLPELDYIQSHQYGAHDAAEYMSRICYQKAARFRKPHYFGEFGTDWQARQTGSDDQGIHLHNGLWSAVVSQAAGTAMLWWWDNYVEPNNLYHHFRPVAAFVDGIPFNETEFRRAAVDEVRYQDPDHPVELETLYLQPRSAGWQPAPFNRPNTFHVGPDGRVTPKDRLSRVLHGVRNHPDLHNPATFQVDYPRAGKFIVAVTGVSGYGGARLKLYLDGQPKLEKDFPDIDDQKKTRTLTQYNGEYAIAVPAGKHTVRVVNDGNDWVYVEYALTNYRRRTAPAVDLFALQCDPQTANGLTAIAWMKNERYNWYNYAHGETFRSLDPWRFTLHNVPAGKYRIEWWDTTRGTVTKSRSAVAAGGKLVVAVDSFTRDVACKVFRTP